MITLLLVAAPAAAKVRSAPPAGGPVLNGDSLVWAVARADGGVDVLRGTSTSDRRIIQGIAPTRTRVRPQLDASPGQIVVVADHLSDDLSTEFRHVYAGPPGGPLARLGGECSLNGPDWPRPADLSDGALAYEPCDGLPGVEVREPGPPPMTQRIAAGRGRGLRLAGRYIAWVETTVGWNGTGIPGDIVVYDRAAMREAYRIPEESLGEEGAHSLDLQDDGTLAVSYDEGLDAVSVAWASPAEPRLHRIIGPSSRWYDVRIARDRIGFLRGRSVDFEIASGEVGIADLAGRVRVLARGAHDRIGRESFDYDGERVAWYSLGCTQALIQSRRISDPPLPFRPRRGCALRFRRKPVVGRSGTFKLRPNCFGFADDSCEPRDVRVTRRGMLLANGRRARVRLTSTGERSLRPGGRLKVTIAATLTDYAGRRERRKRTVTLARAG